MSEQALFRAEHIYKNFGVVQALKDFGIEIFPGEIRGLIGELELEIRSVDSSLRL